MKGNHLPFDLQVEVVKDLAECCNIRSIERKKGIHRDTIMRLGARVGKGCAILHDELMRELPCKEIEIDELHSFVGKKQSRVTFEEDAAGWGDRRVYAAIDRHSKIVPSCICGKRDFSTTYKFGHDLAPRFSERVLISSDGANDYIPVILDAFGPDKVDYGQIIKNFTHEKSAHDPNRKYSPPRLKKTKSRRRIIYGDPEREKIGTSRIESFWCTLRNFTKRQARLSVCFSRKVENMDRAVALFTCYHNFVKVHDSLETTPWVAIGRDKRPWSYAKLTALALERCPITQNTSDG